VKPGTVALTFDDGPQKVFTEHILDLLKSYNAKATFFITGNNINKGQIDIHHADVIKRTEREGHQIASHTWTHLNLSRISSVDRKNQLWMNEMALRNILGKIPTYLRPPYSSCTEESGCQKDVEDLGYHITNFDVDTDDYNQNTPENIQKSKDLFVGKISQEQKYKSDDERAWLSIGHDILEQTAMNLTEYMLETLVQLNYTAVTVGECLNDPKENWYRKAEGAETSVETNTSVSRIVFLSLSTKSSRANAAT
jgi:peptidoglycan/xylan/chitin deacetylase (PgdA/CDA1 family)